MTTVRQIERQWNAKAYGRLSQEMLAARPEAGARLALGLARAVPATALALLRLDELNLAHVPFYPKLLRSLLAAQEADGGWGDPLTTALALRALLNGQGSGLAIERGTSYLANLQRPEGIWPNEPMRRMPGDPFISAFVLYQLGDRAEFRQGIRFQEAVNWFEIHSASLEADVRRLWDRAALRWRPHMAIQREFKSDGVPRRPHLRCA
jgi:hypothetical protein